MLAFHATLHPRPEAAGPGVLHLDAWGTWPTLTVQSAGVATFPVGFDAVLAALERLPRMFVEPDGAIVWRGPAATGEWQLDGTLSERHDRVAACELKGSCPPEALDQLLAAVGWPGVAVIFELVRAGVWLDEATFRRHAAARGNAGDGQTLRPA
jgi:hypothetical protein